MADPVIQTSRVWLGGYDISGQLNMVSLKAGRTQLADARLTDDISATYPGIQTVDAQTDGFYSAGSGEADTVAASRIIMKDASEWPLTVLPPGAPGAPGADGNVAYNLRSAQFAMYFGADHGQSLPFRLKSGARTGLLDRGLVMLPKTTYAATTTGTAWQMRAVGAAEFLVTVLHVFAVTGGTWTLTIESDNAQGFGTPIVRQTFSGATGITRETISTAGAITDDWYRAVLTKSGGTSCVVGVASFVSGT